MATRRAAAADIALENFQQILELTLAHMSQLFVYFAWPWQVHTKSGARVCASMAFSHRETAQPLAVKEICLKEPPARPNPSSCSYKMPTVLPANSGVYPMHTHMIYSTCICSEGKRVDMPASQFSQTKEVPNSFQKLHSRDSQRESVRKILHAKPLKDTKSMTLRAKPANF